MEMARIAQIVSTARYLPERVITNAHLASRLAAGGNASLIDKFAAATGIPQRYCVPDDWATSDLALPAAKEALKRAGRKPEDVSLIIVGTDSPDYITPDTSVVLQHKIGAKNSGTFDVGCACASFPACLAIASGLIATNPDLKTVLVIGVYLMHQLAIRTIRSASSTATAPAPPFWKAATCRVSSAPRSRPTVRTRPIGDIFAGGTAEPASVDAVKAGRTQSAAARPTIRPISTSKAGRCCSSVSRRKAASRPTTSIN